MGVGRPPGTGLLSGGVRRPLERRRRRPERWTAVPLGAPDGQVVGGAQLEHLDLVHLDLVHLDLAADRAREPSAQPGDQPPPRAVARPTGHSVLLSSTHGKECSRCSGEKPQLRVSVSLLTVASAAVRVGAPGRGAATPSPSRTAPTGPGPAARPGDSATTCRTRTEPTPPGHRRPSGPASARRGASACSGLAARQVNILVSGSTPEGGSCAGPHFALPAPSCCPDRAGRASAGGPASLRRGPEGGVGWRGVGAVPNRPPHPAGA